MLLFSSSSCFFLILLLFFNININNSSNSWIKENLGSVSNWYYDNKNPHRAYVSTIEGVIACIDLENNGNIIWRQVLDIHDTLNKFMISFDKKSLITLSNNNIIRKWKKNDGSLLWESKQFKKINNNNYINSDINIIDNNNRMILIDNLNKLYIYDYDENSLIKQNPLNNNQNTSNYKHKIYTNQISKKIYIITFYIDNVIINIYSLTTGELIDTVTEYKHECNSIPMEFELNNNNNNNELLTVFYECDSNSFHAFSFNIDKLSIIPLSVSFDDIINNNELNEWKFELNGDNKLELISDYCISYGVDIDINIKKITVSSSSSSSKCPFNLNNSHKKDFKIKYRGNIRKYWKSFNNKNVGVLYDDGSLCFFSFSNNIDSWCREEGLSSPNNVYIFSESPDESSLCSEDMDESECESVYHAPFPSFSSRLTDDIKSFLTFSGFNANDFLLKLNTFFPITSTWLDSTFQKIITILSSHGKLYGLLSSSGSILWDINLKYLCVEYDRKHDIADSNSNSNSNDYSIVTMLSIRQHPPHLLAIFSNSALKISKIISISSPFYTSQTPHIHISHVDYLISSSFKTPWITDDHSDQITLLISDNNTINIYPFNKQSLSSQIISKNIKKIYYNKLSFQDAKLYGYNINSNNKLSILWIKSFLNSDEEIIDIIFTPHDQLSVNSIYRTGERGGLYKYLNPHLIGLATIESLHNLLHIYLFDGITGRVYLHQYHSHVNNGNGSHGVSLLIDSNKFIYTFFNKLTLLTEITVIDLWLSSPQNLPTKGRTPSEGYIIDSNPLGDSNIFSSFNSYLPYIATQSYNFQYKIDKLLAISHTQYSISSKYIITKLSCGSIIRIDLSWLNTRRPSISSEELTQSNKEEHLIPYKKFIPFNNFATISNNKILNRINNAISTASPIESTSLFLAFGKLDLFYTIINTSKNFDTIPNDFDFIMLFAILSAVIIAIFVFGYWAKSKKIAKEWK